MGGGAGRKDGDNEEIRGRMTTLGACVQEKATLFRENETLRYLHRLVLGMGSGVWDDFREGPALGWGGTGSGHRLPWTRS